MKAPAFDLGLSSEDERAMREARRGRFVLAPEAALRLIADVSPLVDAAVRRRPLSGGSPFTLPGHRESSGAQEGPLPPAAAPRGAPRRRGRPGR